MKDYSRVVKEDLLKQLKAATEANNQKLSVYIMGKIVLLGDLTNHTRDL